MRWETSGAREVVALGEVARKESEMFRVVQAGLSRRQTGFHASVSVGEPAPALIRRRPTLDDAR